MHQPRSQKSRLQQAPVFLAVLALLASAWMSTAQEPQEEEKGSQDEVRVERAVVVTARTVEPKKKEADEGANKDGKEGLASPPPQVILPKPQAPVGASQATVGHRAVKSVRLVVPDGGRVEAARQDDWIAFDRLEADGFYDVYLMQLDSGSESCLTCDNWEFNKKSALSPTWHPSGEYLVIHVQENGKKRGLTLASQSTPARGLGSELWFITRDGRDAWQFTKAQEAGRAVLDPHFSFESELLVWSERVRSREGGPWGSWELRVAKINVKRRVPRLGDGRYYKAGVGLALGHGFSPDDAGLFVSAPTRSTLQPDIARIDLATGERQPITSAPDQYDDLVQAMPNSDFLVWTTDRNLPLPNRLHRISELWLRSTSGLTQERLTFFNDRGASYGKDEALITDVSWMADGERLLLHVLSVEDEGGFGEDIYLVDVGRDYWRDRKAR